MFTIPTKLTGLFLVFWTISFLFGFGIHSTTTTTNNSINNGMIQKMNSQESLSFTFTSMINQIINVHHNVENQQLSCNSKFANSNMFLTFVEASSTSRRVSNPQQLRDAVSDFQAFARSASGNQVFEIIVENNIESLENTISISPENNNSPMLRIRGIRRQGNAPRMASSSSEVLRFQNGLRVELQDLEIVSSSFRDESIRNDGGHIISMKNMKFSGPGDAFVNLGNGEIDLIEDCTFERPGQMSASRQKIRNLASGTIKKIKDSSFSHTSLGGAIANRGIIEEISHVTFRDTAQSKSRSIRTPAIESHGGTIGKIENCVFENLASSGSGAAISIIEGATIKTIQESNFVNCEANSNGGAISVSHGDILESLTELNFKNCGAGSRGGAIYVGSNGKVRGQVAFLKIESCEASNGAAIAIENGDFEAIIHNSEFEKNTARFDGGGISIDRNAKFGGVSGCEFKSNSGSRGSAISIDAAVAVATFGIQGSYFYDNHADSMLGGGTIFTFSSTAFQITENRFVENTAYNAAAIRLFLGAKVSAIKKNVFENNVAQNFGGALLINGDVDVISENLFIGNEADERAAGIYLDDGSISELSANVFFKNKGSAIHNELGVIGPIEDSLFVDNSGLALQNHNRVGVIRRSVFINDVLRAFGPIDRLANNHFADLSGQSTGNGNCESDQHTGPGCPNCNNCSNGNRSRFCPMVNGNAALPLAAACELFAEFGCEMNTNTNECEESPNGSRPSDLSTPPPATPPVSGNIGTLPTPAPTRHRCELRNRNQCISDSECAWNGNSCVEYIPTPAPTPAPTSLEDVCQQLGAIPNRQNRVKRCRNDQRCAWYNDNCIVNRFTDAPTPAPTSVADFCSQIDSINNRQNRVKRCRSQERCAWYDNKCIVNRFTDAPTPSPTTLESFCSGINQINNLVRKRNRCRNAENCDWDSNRCVIGVPTPSPV